MFARLVGRASLMRRFWKAWLWHLAVVAWLPGLFLPFRLASTAASTFRKSLIMILWIQAHLEGYGFDLQNPEAVMRGEKPIVKEVRWNWINLCGPLILQIGPFIYKAVTVKDSVNMSNGETNLKYGNDGKTLTFRPRWDWWLRVTGMTLVPHP